jgi:hypothetical protein
MWIFTTKGFISLVVDRHEPTLMHVRARVREDILAHFPNADVQTWPGADYLYRAILPKSEVAAMMWDEIMTSNTQSHFKDVALQRSAKAPWGSRHTAYYSIWGAMSQLQPIAPYSTVPRGSALQPKPAAPARNTELWYRNGQQTSAPATHGRYAWSMGSYGEDAYAADQDEHAGAIARMEDDAAAAANVDLIHDGQPVDTLDDDITEDEWTDILDSHVENVNKIKGRRTRAPRLSRKGRRNRKGRK